MTRARPARDSAGALGVQAYAHGDAVALASAPDRHEAARVVPLRIGVALGGGGDEPGAAYEQRADGQPRRLADGVERIAPANAAASP